MQRPPTPSCDSAAQKAVYYFFFMTSFRNNIVGFCGCQWPLNPFFLCTLFYIKNSEMQARFSFSGSSATHTHLCFQSR